jgi:large subunit ribosomal protein L6
MAKKEKAAGLKEELEIPSGITVAVEGTKVSVKKGNNLIERDFNTKQVSIKMEGGKFIVYSPKSTKRERRVAGSILAHLKNFFRGVEKKHVYKLKICSGHFPMTVALSGKDFVIKNFLGETVSRTVRIKEGASVKIDGNFVIVESNSIELAGQTAASIEQLTRISDRDSRVFQDGIYIIEKDGEPIV